MSNSKNGFVSIDLDFNTPNSVKMVKVTTSNVPTHRGNAVMAIAAKVLPALFSRWMLQSLHKNEAQLQAWVSQMPDVEADPTALIGAPTEVVWSMLGELEKREKVWEILGEFQPCGAFACLSCCCF